jgi:2-isopropylmalate synthase
VVVPGELSLAPAAWPDDAGPIIARQSRRIVLYDTTLRDGAQTQGVDFSVADKQVIAAELDRLGVDYIEGGWPGANPADDAFFANPPRLSNATLTAFGMTRRPGRSMVNDPVLRAVLGAGTTAVCLVGKASHQAVEIALRITPAENLDLIGETVAEAVSCGHEVLFDAEHFFDGYRLSRQYALSCLRRAHEAGAAWLVLCDTNGGTLPEEISTVVGEVVAALPDALIGIHTHNDMETAVAGSLAAIEAGARMIQGTLNGLGERCGNANLTSLIPTLMLKLGYQTGVSTESLRRLTEVSRMLDRRLHRRPNRYAAYVGESAFTHKAGLHAAAIARDHTTYEHVAPSHVGNDRRLLVSSQAGRANLINRLSEIGVALPADDPRIPLLLETIKRREFEGYAYDGAEASFELLARRTTKELPEFFRIVQLSVKEERSWDAKGGLRTLSKATMVVMVQGRERMATAEGDAAVHALDAALRTVLMPLFPALMSMQLDDCRTHVHMEHEGAKPMIRAIIDSRLVNGSSSARWSTVGVSDNMLDASIGALCDAVTYCLFRAHWGELGQVGIVTATGSGGWSDSGKG